MWHVSSRSNVATFRTAIHLLLTYLLTITYLRPYGASRMQEHAHAPRRLISSSGVGRAVIILAVMTSSPREDVTATCASSRSPAAVVVSPSSPRVAPSELAAVSATAVASGVSTATVSTATVVKATVVGDAGEMSLVVK